eukprot:7381868-Prymnesium_polylepis.1
MRFNKIVHCVAAEPHAVFLRVAVSDGGQEVAFETLILGRLQRGYRVFLLRSMLGTRIELCYILAKISFRGEPNLWLTPRQVSRSSSMHVGFRKQMGCPRPMRSRTARHLVSERHHIRPAQLRVLHGVEMQEDFARSEEMET